MIWASYKLVNKKSAVNSEVRVEEWKDEEGRSFHFVHIHHKDGNPLAIHFSAFFGDWGDAKPYRAAFQGYFHRLRMLGPDRSFNWLFVCDEYGADSNGTYYTGKNGDLFVERATEAIIAEVMRRERIDAGHVLTVGSSMGATGALKFGLRMGVQGIVAIAPHVDLDTSAVMQRRMRHVRFILPDSDVIAPRNHRYTRQITSWLENSRAVPPRLFVQTCRDDVGVYPEQVVPLVDRWQAAGGRLELDLRDKGGHTSDYATRLMLVDVLDCIRTGREAPIHRYQTDPQLRGELVRLPLRMKAKRLGARLRNRVLRRQDR